MRKWVLILFLSVPSGNLFGQQLSDEYYRLNPFDAPAAFPMSDTMLFYAPAGSDAGEFDRLTAYGMSFVSYLRRGRPRIEENYLFFGLPVFAAQSGYPDYTLLGAVRSGRFVAQECYPSSILSAPDMAAGVGGVDFSLSPARWPGRFYASFGFSGRGYGFRGSVGAWGSLGREWYAGISLERRWGRDSYVRGVYADAGAAVVALGKSFRDGGALTLAFAADPSLRGLRSWTTAEVFDLAADDLYNPSWGWWNGRPRNARSAGSFTPLAAASYSFDAARAGRITLSAGFLCGRRTLGGLLWFDAPDPYPDSYTRLPSYFADARIAGETAASWRSGASGTALVDWSRLCETNRYSASGAVYMLASRVERPRDFHAAVSGRAELSERLAVEYGAGFDRRRSEVFRRADDLLDGGPFGDFDRYLVGDEQWGDRYLNDLRRPDRMISRGDRFGFDYRLSRTGGRITLGAVYAYGRLRFSARGMLSRLAYRRTGRCEKQTFPALRSLGHSRAERFSGYRFELTAGWSVTVRSDLSAYVALEARPPETSEVFLLPDYSNDAAAGVGSFRTFRAGARYRLDVRVVRFDAAAYVSYRSRESRVYRYFDDLFSEYCVMRLSGVSWLAAGFELGATADLSPHFSLSVAAAFNRYAYRSDPHVDIYSGIDLRTLLTGGRSGLKGYVCSPSPQTVACASLTFRHPSGWRAALSYVFAADRYVEAEPLRRTVRVASVAASPEARAGLAAQERLPSASTLNLYVSKRFVTRAGDFTASLSADNLLGTRGTVYGGREQMRLRRRRSGAAVHYEPFPSRYLYSYPLVVRATVSYTF